MVRWMGRTVVGELFVRNGGAGKHNERKHSLFVRLTCTVFSFFRFWLVESVSPFYDSVS